MAEKDDTRGDEATRHGPETGARADARRELLLMRSGPHAFGVFADESDGVAQFSRAAPFPFAPPAVLGVISARGRMRTLIDPSALLGRANGAPHGEATEAVAPRRAVVLKGDEQLALAFEHDAGTVEISPADISPAEPAHDFSRGTIEHEGTRVVVLDPARLFEAAVRGGERRRTR